MKAQLDSDQSLPNTRILGDHRKRGSRFVPPLVDAIEQNNASLHPRSWTTELPEILWLSLCRRMYGDRRAVKLVTALARTSRQHVVSPLSNIFGAVTHYVSVSNAQWSAVRREMMIRGDLPLIQQALRPLVALYPACPMAGLYEDIPCESVEAHVTLLSEVVRDLFDRDQRSTVMTQACFTWLAFDADVLKVRSDVVLSKFPKVEDYPATELSRKIASAIRNSNRVLFGPPHYYDKPAVWVNYFWNRGMEISDCRFQM